ncbi:MAG: hypothetical protein P1P82_13075 [Bacteroidales bacterium]|nr:hypothetical protein [Bacteroidales bacterium]MDT8432725.1 hypothetical protein [Bacteroidales bacterium]
MRIVFLLLISLFLIYGCKNASHSDLIGNLKVASEFIDAFYSFNKDSLQSILSQADETRQSILFYQGWAECGNYEIVDRPKCIVKNDSLILCPVTVKDDLLGALQIDFYVTDTFHLTIVNQQIRSVNTSSNDPVQYYQAKEWVKLNRPELIELPCEGIWEKGTTPCECVQAMVRGFVEYAASKDSESSNSF